MVGVPGRSKGCITCRRRKKGCDLQRPSCGQCLKSGKECGGYDRQLIILHHSPAKASLAAESPNSSSSESGIVAMNPESCMRTAYQLKFHDLFWDLYLPKQSFKFPDPTTWVPLVQQLSTHNGLLHPAFLAISSARIGHGRHDIGLVQEGAKFYGRALRQIQYALWDPEKMYSDEILAASMLLGLYEMQEGSSQRMTNWLSHSRGTARLIELRGPERHISKEPHRMFIGARTGTVIAAVTQRRSTFLSKLRWLTVPWRETPKTTRDRLIDIMTFLPSLLEQLDDTTEITDQDQAISARLQLLIKCKEVDQALQAWYLEFTAEIGTVPLWLIEPSDPGSPFPWKYSFRDHILAHTLSLYWATCLTTYGTMRDLHYRLKTSITAQNGIWSGNGSVGAKSPFGFESPDMSATLPDLPKHVSPRQYAMHIAHSLPYFLSPEMGALGPSIISFPMAVAMVFFRDALVHPNPENSVQGQHKIRTFDQCSGEFWSQSDNIGHNERLQYVVLGTWESGLDADDDYRGDFSTDMEKITWFGNTFTSLNAKGITIGGFLKVI